MAERPALHLEELNLKYEGGKPRNTPTAHESLEAGWFLSTPSKGLSSVTFYPDPDHTWDGGTQEGRES